MAPNWPDNAYQRQEILAQWPGQGQATLAAASVAILGVGGLGSHVAQFLVRSGVGHLRLVDCDVVEFSNLHRTALYTPEDVGKPKAKAAQQHLNAINPGCTVESRVVRVDEGTILEVIRGADVVVDGFDRLPPRYILNRACASSGTPWVHAGATGHQAQLFPIIPGETACLACVWPDMPPQELVPTCKEVGIFPTLPALVAAQQARWVVEILLGLPIHRKILLIDQAQGDFRTVALSRNPRCPICGDAADVIGCKKA